MIYPFLIQKKKEKTKRKCFHTMWRWLCREQRETEERRHRDEKKGERKRKAIHSNYIHEASTCALGDIYYVDQTARVDEVSTLNAALLPRPSTPCILIFVSTKWEGGGGSQPDIQWILRLSQSIFIFPMVCAHVIPARRYQ
jgi:hypothetical protein